MNENFRGEFRKILQKLNCCNSDCCADSDLRRETRENVEIILNNLQNGEVNSEDMVTANPEDQNSLVKMETKNSEDNMHVDCNHDTD